MPKETPSDHARALSKLGSSKGGKARAERMSKEERSENARTAALARWEPADSPDEHVIRATHGGDDRPLHIANTEIPCYVLEDKRRVLALRGMTKALGMTYGGVRGERGPKLASFVLGKTLEAFVNAELAARISGPIRFRTPHGNLAYGYEATVLADVCEAVLAARKASKLRKGQMHIADQCEVLVRGFARVGIVALVDEATGYQEDRDKDELQKLLALYVSPELLPWTKRFPDEFYLQLFRLRDWKYRPLSTARSQYVGKLTNWLVYDRLPLGIKQALMERDPVNRATGRRQYKLHQYLTEEIGDRHLERHLDQVIAIMRGCQNWHEFKRIFLRSFPEPGGAVQLELEMDN